jgi:formamidopyrimidine-DNA glycosylase
MMEYPEIICMRDQMREFLIGKRIERVAVEDKAKYKGTIRETLLTQSPHLFRLRLKGGVLVSVDSVCQTLLLATDTGHTLSLGAIYGHIQLHPTPETAIEQGGRWNEKDLHGNPGGFVPHVCKDTLGQACPDCGAPIERFRFEGGFTYLCPGCQAPPVQ